MTVLLADRVTDVILTPQQQGTVGRVHAWAVSADHVQA